jgi:hypothetical protein
MDYELKMLVPEQYATKKVVVSAGAVKTAQEGKVLTLAFHNASAGPVNWSVEF